MSTNFYTAIWFDCKTRPAVKSDADIEGYIWTYQELFSRDEETDEMKSIGFHVRRSIWREAAVSRNMPNEKLLWTHSNLTKPMAPEL